MKWAVHCFAATEGSTCEESAVMRATPRSYKQSEVCDQIIIRYESFITVY